MTQSPEDHAPLADEPFDFTNTKNGAVLLYARGKLVKTVRGKEAERLRNRLDGASATDVQLLLAKATGQFKFGNERR